jgi:hypothetical protein
LTDATYRDDNEFCGVVKLKAPIERSSDSTDIEAILPRIFDLQEKAVKLVSWSRPH